MTTDRVTQLRWLVGGALLALSASYLLNSPALRSQDAKAPQPPHQPVAAPVPTDGKLRVIVFGAHPDDCELRAGGVAARWAALGHHVKFVSVTNGDIGHWGMAGGALARRRAVEVKKCAGILGTTAEMLDVRDGEHLVTMENRRTICRLIREWKADVIISRRPNDYDPDHRYVGVLVMEAA